MPRGRFIALEGIDGSGTTHQCRALAKALRDRGHVVLETHEPSDGSIGRLIRERLALKSAPTDPRALALLFAADRLDHVHNRINPALARGEVVLSDRYVMSSWVYQALDCNRDWVQEINRHAPWPDLTLLLEIPPETAMDRVTRRQQEQGAPPERFEVLSTLGRLASAYAEIARAPELVGVHRVDGQPPREQVTEALLAVLTGAGL
jgi:dTMP kinase